MRFKVNVAKGTNWQIMEFLDGIVYGAEQNGTAKWSQPQSMLIEGPFSENGQDFFIFVDIAGYVPTNLPLGLLCRYQPRNGAPGQFGVLAVNDLQKDFPQ